MKTSAKILAILMITFIFSSCNEKSEDGSLSRQAATGMNLDAQADRQLGEVIWVEGLVSLNGNSADIGDSVQNGDILSVGPAGSAEITFGHGRVLKAGPETFLTLDASTRVMSLEKGSLGVFQTKSRKLFAQDSWELQTPTVVAAVRGTTYYTKVEGPDQVYFCLCNGKINLTDTVDGKVHRVKARHHEAFRFLRTSDGVVSEEAPMLYHTDEEMENLVSHVDEEIDWTKISR